jgi:hypothetical protein
LTAPQRLGDLLRVVHELQPRPEELELIRELLPVPSSAEPSEVRAERVGIEKPGVGDGARSSGPGAPSRRAARRERRRSGARGRVGARRSLLTESGVDRRTRTVVAGLVLVLSALRATGRFGLVPWLVAVLALLAARPGWGVVERGWSAWRESSQRLSFADHDALQDGAAARQPLEAGEVTLTRARWQPPAPGRPLVAPRQQRSVATLLAGRPTPGEMDLAATVRAVASRRPLGEVPLRLRWSTNRGMHLHVDVGPALEPFRHDVEELRASLVAVASPHAVIELGFTGDPRVITWPRRVVGHHQGLALAERLPSAGTPVLVVTDLGIAVPRSGSPPEPDYFLRHHRLLRQAGCRVRYLVPYPPERWPARLSELPVVYWRDDLGATDVLTALRRRPRAT